MAIDIIWIRDDAALAEHCAAWRRLPFSRDAYFIVDRAPPCEYGVAVQGLSRDKDALLSRATRHLFAVPWRDKTLIGVWHCLFPEFPDAAHVQRPVVRVEAEAAQGGRDVVGDPALLRRMPLPAGVVGDVDVVAQRNGGDEGACRPSDGRERRAQGAG